MSIVKEVKKMFYPPVRDPWERLKNSYELAKEISEEVQVQIKPDEDLRYRLLYIRFNETEITQEQDIEKIYEIISEAESINIKTTDEENKKIEIKIRYRAYR